MYLEEPSPLKWISPTLDKFHHPNTRLIPHNPNFALQWTFAFIGMMYRNPNVASYIFILNILRQIRNNDFLDLEGAN